MPDISLFDVIGPCMIGPSSSHTAGACRMAHMARVIFSDEIARVRFTLYGSFAETYLGHGTDKALLGGILGFATDDMRIRDAYRIAEEQGVAFSFVEDRETETAHPNTVDILLENRAGDHKLLARAVSIGGGKIKVIRLDDIDLDFSGMYPTLIVHHANAPGVISYITGILGDYMLNIATMRCYCEPDGRNAYSIIESDRHISPEIIGDIECNRMILKTILIQEV